MKTVFLVIMLKTFAAFNFLLFQQNPAGAAEAGRESSGVTIFMVPLLLILLVIFVVGLPFYMNYRKRILPEEKQNQKR